MMCVGNFPISNLDNLVHGLVWHTENFNCRKFEQRWDMDIDTASKLLRKYHPQKVKTCLELHLFLAKCNGVELPKLEYVSYLN